jgi:Tfp pilus assembly protein PilF
MKLFMVAVVAVAALFLGANAWADMAKTSPALQTQPGSKADMHNKEGIEHYNQGHWDVAKTHFEAATKEDPKSGEAHYNLALSLDKLGDHKAATQHFHEAHGLGKNNPDIQNSEILKKHTGMK